MAKKVYRVSKKPDNKFINEEGKEVTMPTIDELAKELSEKYGVTKDYAKEQLEAGRKAELKDEHTEDPDFALKIAHDHLLESIEYYPELEKMEEKLAERDRMMEEGGIVGNFSISESKHTKTGETIWLVKSTAKLSRDEFKKLEKEINKLGGYYSRFAHAFLFKEDPTEKLSGKSEPEPEAESEAESDA